VINILSPTDMECVGAITFKIIIRNYTTYSTNKPDTIPIIISIKGPINKILYDTIYKSIKNQTQDTFILKKSFTPSSCIYNINISTRALKDLYYNNDSLSKIVYFGPVATAPI